MDETKGVGTSSVQRNGDVPSMRRLPRGSIIGVQKLRRGKEVWKLQERSEPQRVRLEKKPPDEGDYFVFVKFGKKRFLKKEERTLYCTARNVLDATRQFMRHLNREEE